MKPPINTIVMNRLLTTGATCFCGWVEADDAIVFSTRHCDTHTNNDVQSPKIALAL